jgi:hypothetical protein
MRETSSLTPQTIEHQLTTMTFLSLKLSIVRIFHRTAIHTKKLTLEGSKFYKFSPLQQKSPPREKTLSPS